MTPLDAIRQEYDHEVKTTRRVLERVPDDRLGWRPHPKSMSLGQLALHIAAVPSIVAAMVQADSFEPPLGQAPEAKSRTEVLDRLTQSSAALDTALKGLDDRRLHGNVSFTRNGQTFFEMPRMAVLRSILLNHSYHHRGQLSVYLRELDVPVPSIYGPSADENPFA